MLRYLIHLVGSIHLPLTTVDFFSQNLLNGELRDGDTNGKKIKLEFKNKKWNLNEIWGSLFGKFDK